MIDKGEILGQQGDIRPAAAGMQYPKTTPNEKGILQLTVVILTYSGLPLNSGVSESN